MLYCRAKEKTKDNDAHILVEEEYNIFHKKQEKNLEEDIKTMKFIISLSQNKEIKESLDSLNFITAVTSVNPLNSVTPVRSVNPFTELYDAPEKQEQLKSIQTSIYSNYITIGLKFPNYKNYHLHAFVDI